MSRVLWASAVIAFGISLTPNVALAANSKHSRSHSQDTNRGSTNNKHDGSDATRPAARRVTVMAVGAGYGTRHGSPAVRSLQRQLLEQGSSPGPLDGRYGPLTAAAVRRFQRAHGLAVDGIVGPHTRKALATGTLSAGAGYLQPHGSSRVRSLQGRLATAGFSPGPVDGRYGPLTTQAVRRFQQAHHLPADGITGLHTQAALGRQAKLHPRVGHRHKLATGKPAARPKQHPAPAPSRQRPKTTAPSNGHGPAGWVIALVLAALAISAMLALMGLRARRRKAAATGRAPAREAGATAPQATAETASGAGNGAAPVTEAGAAQPQRPAISEPEQPADRQSDHASDVEAPGLASGAEMAAGRLSAKPEDDEADGCPPEAPPVDPARAERVKALQRQLDMLGFDPGPVDGRFGPQTTDAIKHLQEAHDLRPDGIVGPLTAEVLRQNAPESPADERAERVKMLQRQLSWLGFEPGPTDGRYGPLTTGAVKRFQEAHDLPVDGIVGHATAETLRASIAQRPSSDRIERVKALQRQLQWLGLEPGAIDGRYGPRTAEAVRRFQEDRDLPADGIVDPATQRALQLSMQRTGQW
ncbi:MAG: peptidoglycan-binding protein [Solirubrobacteraceae bacterium]